MKTLLLGPAFRTGWLAVCVLFAVASGLAQTNSTLSVVRIRAADAFAGEPSDPGLFTVTRDGGGTNYDLRVFYHIGGSADNGHDYATISNSVIIRAGSFAAGIEISPIDDTLIEGFESVELALTPSPAGVTPAYWIGSPSNAVVTIADNDRNTETNVPPTVRLVAPTNNSIFTAPADILLIANANDLNGYMTIQTVEFFAGTNSLGIRTNYPTLDPIGPFKLLWSNVPPGEYKLTAKATDDHGAIGMSDPVFIAVRQPSPIPFVSIRALDSHAAEGGFNSGVSNNIGDIGVFTISRTDHTNVDLRVYYTIGGTASNGVDYSLIGDSVVIPAGAFSANVVIKPVDDTLIEGTETATLTLLSLACVAIVPPPPDCYFVGSPSNAVVFIEDNDRITNAPPRVQITSPTNGAVFAGPATIPITAEATDTDDAVVRVEFFAGDHFLGRDIGTNKASYGIVWSNALPGFYSLTARAFDSRGGVGGSEPVRITVTGTNPPPTNLPAVVTIRASDAHAAEGGYNSGVSNTVGDIGVFTISRTDHTDIEMRVYYRIGGTASNGVDYSSIGDSVVIPAGALSANVVIKPVDDALIEGTESVNLTLVPPLCAAIMPPPPECYVVGSPSNAVVFIEDNDRITNAPPKVHIIAPTNGTVFAGPATIPITAEAADSDDDVVRVEFFAGDRFLGRDVGTNKASYGIVWSNALPGFYSLTARAFDSRGGAGGSEPVRITVTGTNPPPPNLPPVVTIFAADSVAGEGTNCSRWYSNSIYPPPGAPCTNTATFVVRRSGPTNASLTVNYEIGGTASNGVDYAAIPDSVTIPAGERSARIVIKPIDDDEAECAETVILHLLQSTNPPAPYLVGWPGRAAAIIVDNEKLPPDTGLLCDRTFHLCSPVTNGLNYRVEVSIDLVNWLPAGTNTVSEPNVHFTDPESADFPNRFYRIVPNTSQWMPPPPPEATSVAK